MLSKFILTTELHEYIFVMKKYKFEKILKKINIH